MLVNFIRTLILVLLVFIVLRIMGKKQIGELDPFEFVITLMIAELASTPMGDIGIPLMNGIIPIIALLFLQLLFSYLSLKSDTARKLLSGIPSVIIRNGKFIEEELSRLRCNIPEVMEQLRICGIADIDDVAFGVLETNGKLSVIPQSSKKPVTPDDLELKVPPAELPQLIIVDGEFQKNVLRTPESQKKAASKLQKLGYSNIQNILYAVINSEGEIKLQAKNTEKKGKT